MMIRKCRTSTKDLLKMRFIGDLVNGSLVVVGDADAAREEPPFTKRCWGWGGDRSCWNEREDNFCAKMVKVEGKNLV